MRLHTSLVASAFAAAAASLISNVARADCAAPRSYTTHVDGDSVTICPTNPDSKNAAGCPVAGGMLRRDTATGAVVKLADQCTGADPGCYVDECVPTGIYQYGYGEPYECCTSCCGTMLASSEVMVGATGTGTCAPGDAGSPAPADAAPWEPSNPSICDYTGDGPNGGGDGSVAPTHESTSSSSGGCSLARPMTTEHEVLMVDGLAAVIGLGVLARRRSRKK